MHALPMLLVANSFMALPVPGIAAAPPDIHCQDHAYGVERVYQLTISGPQEKTWKYLLTKSGEEQLRMVGTYELVDGLAIFTGKVNGQDEVRFGFNYAFHAGEVEFNGFFPSGQSLRYHRKWFRRVKGAWQPAKEVILSMPSPFGGAGGWAVPFKGERMVWDDTGQVKRDQIDIKAIYRGQGSYFSLSSNRTISEM